jgi:hypothetical protein
LEYGTKKIPNQAFSTLGGSDTEPISNEKLKEFVKTFDLDMNALLAAADDGDGAMVR